MYLVSSLHVGPYPSWASDEPWGKSLRHFGRFTRSLPDPKPPCYGPVFPIEYIDAPEDKDSFEISVSKFASFNHGMEYFGEHNKDKNGEIVLPVTVKIEKKKLDISAN